MLEEPTVVRTWRRDLSKNFMPLDVAVSNLARNLGADGETIRGWLLSGLAVDTKHARFMLARGEGR